MKTRLKISHILHVKTIVCSFMFFLFACKSNREGKIKIVRSDTSGSLEQFSVQISGIDNSTSLTDYREYFVGCNNSGSLCNSSCPAYVVPFGKYNVTLKYYIHYPINPQSVVEKEVTVSKKEPCAVVLN